MAVTITSEPVKVTVTPKVAKVTITPKPVKVVVAAAGVPGPPGPAGPGSEPVVATFIAAGTGLTNNEEVLIPVEVVGDLPEHVSVVDGKIVIAPDFGMYSILTGGEIVGDFTDASAVPDLPSGEYSVYAYGNREGGFQGANAGGDPFPYLSGDGSGLNINGPIDGSAIITQNVPVTASVICVASGTYDFRIGGYGTASDGVTPILDGILTATLTISLTQLAPPPPAVP